MAYFTVAREGPKPNTKLSRADKQTALLQKRQLELKQAALKAKKDGDLELALDYLRQSKGIEPLINASMSGLPVDMTSIPLSPDSKLQLQNHGYSSKAESTSSDDGFTFVSGVGECIQSEEGATDQQIYENMEKQLTKQINVRYILCLELVSGDTKIKLFQWCLSTRDHCKALADVPGYNRWERLALDYSKDLDMLRVRKRDCLRPPQHHYEVKTHAIVQYVALFLAKFALGYFERYHAFPLVEVAPTSIIQT